MGIKEQLELVNQTTSTSSGVISSGQTEFLESLNGDSITASTNGESAPVSQKIRSFLGGFSYQFADEIEGMIVALATSGKSYEEARDEVRKKIKDYEEAHPGEALAFEISGAVLPTLLLTIFGGPSGWANAVRTISQLGTKLTGRLTTKEIAHMSGKMGGAYSYGAGTEGVFQDLANVPKGYLTGVAVGAGMSKAINWAGVGINRLIEKAKGMAGKEFSEVVRSEIARIAEGTGLTPDEVVQKIARGEILAENETLVAVMRALKSDLGGETNAIISKLKTRPLETKNKALTEMQESIGYGTSDKNTVKIWKMKDSELRELENKLYTTLFKDTNPELPNRMIHVLFQQLKNFPQAAKMLNEMYKVEGGFVPFVRWTKSGEMKMVRQPTLKDAELVYRMIRDKASELFNTGKSGQIASKLSENANKLKDKIDIFSPELAATRLSASQLRAGRDAYEVGRKALTQNPEDLELLIEKFADVPNALEALQAGLMTSIKNKASSQTTIMKNIALDGHKLNQIVRMIFPKGNIDDILAKATIAGQSQTASTAIRFGSPTAPQQQASSTLGRASLLYRAAQGDPIAITQVVAEKIAKNRPNLKPADRDQLIKILMSEDQELVKKALIDENSLNMLQKIIDSVLYGTSRVTSAGASKLTGEEMAEFDTGLLGSAKAFTSGFIR